MTFQAKRAEQVVCSTKCRNKRAGRTRKRPLSPCPVCGRVPTGGRARKYCSRACYAEAQKKPHRCKVCGTTFLASRPTQQTCSATCAHEAMKLPTKPCEQCHKTFRPKSSRVRYCGRACSAKASGLAKRKGPHLNAKGYVVLYEPDHPMAMKTGYVLEHRKVAAEMVGRMLQPDEVVHHRNEIKTDNRPENLAVLTKADHDRIPKPPPKPIECPHCGGKIKVSGRVRRVEAL